MEDMIKLIEEKIENKDYEEALRLCNEAIEKEPNNAKLYTKRRKNERLCHRVPYQCFKLRNFANASRSWWPVRAF